MATILSTLVQIRGVQEKDWKLLRDKLKDRFLGWESTAFPMASMLSASPRPTRRTILPMKP